MQTISNLNFYELANILLNSSNNFPSRNPLKLLNNRIVFFLSNFTAKSDFDKKINTSIILTDKELCAMFAI